ncbi:hypothetical protein QVD17_28156 [Tagetes erecta]|uniref:Uncharacterized protein n=1 Tax=Tagetes erecta TaxID=13708 RepID=A0AAD8KCU2_TARER|nr:hypothetical protein QVD17_28156 [Tagetes erecta]
MSVFSFKNFYKNQTVLPVTHPRPSNTHHPTTSIQDRVSYIWAQYHQLVASVEEIITQQQSQSVLSFIIMVLLAFVGIKSQCQPGFPFQTHTRLVRFSVNSGVICSFCFVAQLIASGVDRTAVYAPIAILGTRV